MPQTLAQAGLKWQPGRVTVLENGAAPLPREALDEETIPGRPCPVAATLALVGEKWSLLALREVFYGNHRFNDIARGTGAPRDRLAARLKALVDAGVLERRAYSENPVRYGYHLTPAGAALSPVLRELVRWGNTWALEQPRVAIRHHDHELDAMEICRTCGEQVHRRDLSLQSLAPHWEAG
jgi:DNA-binding HxlR family transcriptional regulator